MSTIQFYSGCAVTSLIAILFMPQNTNWWKYPAFLAIIFGILWFYKKNF